MEKIVVNETMKLPKAVVILGNFDGVHRGHQLLIEKAKEIAKEENLKIAIFTFEPHPSFVLSDRQPQDLIYTSSEKEMIMEGEGIDYYIEFPFTKESAHISPKFFIDQIIVNKLNAKVIIIGADYRFGNKRSGDYKLLVDYSKNHDFDVVVVHKLKHNHVDIGSTWIREEIKKGNIELANTLMGRTFLFSGKVMHGRRIGMKIGFPTANLIPDASKILPPMGVYISKVIVEGKEYQGITNIGKNPTIDDEQKVTVETYLLNFNQDIYDKEIIVNIYHFVRPEKKFDGLIQLQEQIEQDVLALKSYFALKVNKER